MITPNIFVSYSGPLSHAVATEVSNLLYHALSVRVTLFPHQPDAPMWEELKRGLQESTFGICCITRDSARSRWLHFEAGALLHLPRRSSRDRGARPSPVVPMYFPAKPYRGADHSDDPLWTYKGLSASPAGLADLVHRIAESHGLPRRTVWSRRRIAEWWQAAFARLSRLEHRFRSELRVGRFCSFHDDILNNCNTIDAKDNDFRKFLCDRVLRSTREATGELTGKRKDILDFSDFSHEVCHELAGTLEIAAICGDKPWSQQAVRDYYRRQFEWARDPPDGTVHISSQWRMRRIFVQKDRRFPPRIARVIDQHAELAGYRVAAGVLSLRQALQTEPDLKRVWGDLIERGFGFVALRSEAGWRVFAHMKRESAPPHFLCAEFSSRLIVRETLELFDRLWNRSRHLGFGPPRH